MKLGLGIRNFFRNIIDFLKDSVRELKKVRWPSRKELISYSKVVIFTVVFVTVFFVVTDFIISLLLQLIGFGK
ncbi:MAG: preprotein translocase subunit SecE [Vulcanibacillus sp.]